METSELETLRQQNDVLQAKNRELATKLDEAQCVIDEAFNSLDNLNYDNRQIVHQAHGLLSSYDMLIIDGEDGISELASARAACDSATKIAMDYKAENTKLQRINQIQEESRRTLQAYLRELAELHGKSDLKSAVRRYEILKPFRMEGGEK